MAALQFKAAFLIIGIAAGRRLLFRFFFAPRPGMVLDADRHKAPSPAKHRHSNHMCPVFSCLVSM